MDMRPSRFGAGGICDGIADALCGVLDELGCEAVSAPASVGENRTKNNQR
jgi:hypothetical protein